MLTRGFILVRRPPDLTDEVAVALVQATADRMDEDLSALQQTVRTSHGANTVPGSQMLSKAGIEANVAAGKRTAAALLADADVALKRLRSMEATNANVLTPEFRWAVEGRSAEDVRAQEAEIRARFFALQFWSPGSTRWTSEPFEKARGYTPRRRRRSDTRCCFSCAPPSTSSSTTCAGR
jgi:hypothetical protein